MLYMPMLIQEQREARSEPRASSQDKERFEIRHKAWAFFDPSSVTLLTILFSARLTSKDNTPTFKIFDSKSKSNIMQIVDQIQDNTITKLCFTFENEDAIDNIHQIISAIKKNSSILTVELSEDFLGCVRNDARSELLQALASIPCLQEVRLEQGLILVADLAKLLCGVKGLKILTVKNIVLQGVEADFNAVEMALHQHPSIKEFSLDGCRPAIEDISIESLELAGSKQVCAHGGIPAARHNPASARSA